MPMTFSPCRRRSSQPATCWRPNSRIDQFDEHRPRDLLSALASTGRCTTPDPCRIVSSVRALSSEGRRPKRDQRSDAPAWSPSISSVSCWAGVRKPSVWRGRSLSLRRPRRAVLVTPPARLLPFGSTGWQETVGVLVGASLPRASGIAEVDLEHRSRHVNRRCSAISFP